MTTLSFRTRLHSFNPTDVSRTSAQRDRIQYEGRAWTEAAKERSGCGWLEVVGYCQKGITSLASLSSRKPQVRLWDSSTFTNCPRALPSAAETGDANFFGGVQEMLSIACALLLHPKLLLLDALLEPRKRLRAQ
jgi:hypothetical protein